MPSFNKVILMGNFTRDPELRFLPNNTAVCDMGLAVNDRWHNKTTDQWEDRPNFMDCTAFGRTAENISKFFSKGRPIFIEGKLRFEQWEDKQSGQKRSKLKVVIDNWQFVDTKQQESGGHSDDHGQSRGYGNRHQDEAPPEKQLQHQAVAEDEIPF